jgi:peptidyl-prolyl cis-trans isomerase A (cyclophilin A)
LTRLQALCAKEFHLFVSSFTLLVVLSFWNVSKPEEKTVLVVIQTDLGNIEVALDAQRAPITVANFLKYVEEGFYASGRFHRIVTLKNQPHHAFQIEVIQAGISPAKSHAEFPPIPLERTNVTSLKHRDGTISMARDGPDSATSDFFLCIGNQPALDFGGKRNPDGQGFAAFGQVVRGMEIVKKIHASPEQEQTLTPPILIHNILRKK